MKSSYTDCDVVAEEETLEREVAEHVSEAEYEPESYERDMYLESTAYYTDTPVMVPVVYDAQPMMVPVTGICDTEPEIVPETCGSQHVIVPVIHDSQPVTTTSYDLEAHTTTVESVTNQQPTTTILSMYDSQSTVTQICSELELAARSVFESEPVVELCEPTSEIYYTASSEASLLSDMDLQERAQSEDSDRDDRNSVMAGHVAAMRERFESMTRTNTPCPDLIRSASPSFEVFRNVSTSPDVEKS